VRAFFVENALHWVHEYHADGLRLDATHALHDDSPRHFLAELSSQVRESAAGRPVVLVAEDHRNLARLVRPLAAGGFGLDAVWAGDFHHALRRYLTGDRDGPCRDFTGALAEVAVALREGWYYQGRFSRHYGEMRGTSPRDLEPRRFVFFIQNHDQVGNRLRGERLHHRVEGAVWRAASTLLLLAPELPLLFMGQEWAAPEPFLYFVEHDVALGRRVTEGRRREHQQRSALSDSSDHEPFADPQQESTFRRCQLDWSRIDEEPHASTLRLYRELLHLRKREALLREVAFDGFSAGTAGEEGLVLLWMGARSALLVLLRLRGAGTVAAASGMPPAPLAGRSWSVVLTTEEPRFVPDPVPPEIDRAMPEARFARPGAVVMRAGDAGARPR